MTWVKICGMTNLEDALTAVVAGADAVGFVFYEKSPRNISPEAAREIVRELPEEVEKIGVFVHGSGLDPMDVLLKSGLTGMQTYAFPENSPQDKGLTAFGSRVLPKRARFIRALPMKLVMENEEQIRTSASIFAKWKINLPDPPEGFRPQEGLMDTFVLDSGDLRLPGGTGKTFDWKKAVPIAEGMRKERMKVVVAGGLTPANVGEVMVILNPWGVDVVSGVEARPGKKDPQKVREVIGGG